MLEERKLRIAHFSMGRVNPESANGVDKTVYYLARTQAGAGHDVAVFSLTEKPALPISGVLVKTYPPGRLPLSLGSRIDDLLVGRSPLNLPRALVKDVLRWGPDILHLHFVHVPQNVVLAARARRAGISYAVTINGGLSAVAQRRNRLLKRLFKILMEGRYLEQAAFLHVISEQDLEGLRSYGVANSAVLAPNGIDIGSLPDSIDRLAIAKRFPRLEGRRIFMFLGRLDPDQKALDQLIEGFALADETATILLIAGPDWRSNRTQLETMTEALGIADRVVFCGPLFGQEKYDFLAGSDVFVHPSRWEAGIPFSVLEAAASAKPTLLSAGADPSDVFGDRGAGIQAESHPNSIATALKLFARMDRGELESMGSRARSLVELEFAWEPIAQRVVDAYRKYGNL